MIKPEDITPRMIEDFIGHPIMTYMRQHLLEQTIRAWDAATTAEERETIHAARQYLMKIEGWCRAELRAAKPKKQAEY